VNIFSIKNKGVSGNLWKLIIVYITNKRPYVTFLTIFLLTMPNATAQTIGFVSAVGQLCGFLFEVPSGYISDRIGHKNAIIIAKLSFFLSVFMYLIANATIFFYLGAIFLAIGLSMNSGTLSVFLKDSLDDVGKGDQFSTISGKIVSMSFCCVDSINCSSWFYWGV
jgi:MFS family permease